MHIEKIDYNSFEDSDMEENNSLVEIIQKEIKEPFNRISGFPKRDTHVNAAQKRRNNCMKELYTKKMSIMYSSNDFIHHFILYKMDDGRIADIYLKLTEDKNVDVFEYSIV